MLRGQHSVLSVLNRTSFSITCPCSTARVRLLRLGGSVEARAQGDNTAA